MSRKLKKVTDGEIDKTSGIKRNKSNAIIIKERKFCARAKLEVEKEEENSKKKTQPIDTGSLEVDSESLI